MTIALPSTAVRKQNIYHLVQILFPAKGFSIPSLRASLIYYNTVNHGQLLEMLLNLPFRAFLSWNSNLL